MSRRDRQVSLVAPNLAAERSHEVLSRYLRDQILSGAIRVGSLLPPERQFAEQTGFGRSTVREAIRMLVAEGLLSVRSGPERGVEVITPSTHPVRRAMQSYLHGNGLSLDTLIEARCALEPQAAALAALRRDPDALAELERATLAVERSETDAELTAGNTAWHDVLAAASGNALIRSMVEALTYATVASRSTSWYTRTEEARERSLQMHRDVLAAITEGDADTASATMLRHLQSYREMADRLGLLHRSIPYVPEFVRGIQPI